jgi:hypothetical protein
MPLYRLSNDFFLNDFELTGFYFNNRTENYISGRKSYSFFDLPQKVTSSYVIAAKALAVNVTSKSADLISSTHLVHYVFQH